MKALNFLAQGRQHPDIYLLIHPYNKDKPRASQMNYVVNWTILAELIRKGSRDMVAILGARPEKSVMSTTRMVRLVGGSMGGKKSRESKHRVVAGGKL